MAQRRKIRFLGLLYKWHRYTGLAIGLILLMLLVTGILLNHTDRLKLDSRFVSSDTILSWYGIQASNNHPWYQAGGQWIGQIEERVYFNTTRLLENSADLRGAISNGEFVVLAFPASVTLLTPDGEIIEKLMLDAILASQTPPPGPQTEIKQVGTDRQGAVYLDTSAGIFYSKDGLLSWLPGETGAIHWASSSPPPENLATAAIHDSSQNTLPVERVLLDIHSGRFFGPIGVYIIDLTGILLGFLALSGSGIWLNHKLKKWHSLKSSRKVGKKKPRKIPPRL